MTTAPFFADIAYGPEGGAAHWLTTSDGLRIRVAHWPMEAAKGTVLIFPGRTEYAENYGDAARELQARGYASLAIDWRGQGLADRMTPDQRIGHVKEFRDYQKDVSAVVAHAAELGLPRPWYMLAHSMGGCIGLRALHDGLDVQAVAFSAPMWGMQIASWLRPFAWGLPILAKQFGREAEIAPGQMLDSYVLREDFELNTLTNDRQMWDRQKARVEAQPDLALGGPSMGWVYEALRETDALHEMRSPAYPCITFLGTAEKIVDPERVRNRMSRWSEGQLVMLKGGEHEVLIEVPHLRNQVYEAMTAHFDAHP